MIILIGASGQLGHEFCQLFDRLGLHYIAPNKSQLNLANTPSIHQFFADKHVDFIINCAAYNDVDQAEQEHQQCNQLNCQAPYELALIAKNKAAIFVTYSTDLVFDGLKRSPYTEEDTTNPLSIYGNSKLNSEKQVLSAHTQSYIIRTAWLFSVTNQNFNKKLLTWANQNSNLRIVADQISTPTYAADLAKSSWALMNSGQYGLYHLTNSGEASKFEQAQYLLEKIGWKGDLQKANLADFHLPAKRALYTTLDNHKVETVLRQTMPSWQNAIDRFIDELGVKASEAMTR